MGEFLFSFGLGRGEGKRGELREGRERRCTGTGLDWTANIYMADLFFFFGGTIGYVFHATAGDGAQEGSDAGAAGEGRGEAAAGR